MHGRLPIRSARRRKKKLEKKKGHKKRDKTKILAEGYTENKLPFFSFNISVLLLRLSAQGTRTPLLPAASRLVSDHAKPARHLALVSLAAGHLLYHGPAQGANRIPFSCFFGSHGRRRKKKSQKSQLRSKPERRQEKHPLGSWISKLPTDSLRFPTRRRLITLRYRTTPQKELVAKRCLFVPLCADEAHSWPLSPCFFRADNARHLSIPPDCSVVWLPSSRQGTKARRARRLCFIIVCISILSTHCNPRPPLGPLHATFPGTYLWVPSALGTEPTQPANPSFCCAHASQSARQPTSKPSPASPPSPLQASPSPRHFWPASHSSCKTLFLPKKHQPSPLLFFSLIFIFAARPFFFFSPASVLQLGLFAL